MPKRKHSDRKEEKWRKKIKKYEEKLLRKHPHYDYESYSEDSDQEMCDESPPLCPSPSPMRSVASAVARAPNVAEPKDTEVCDDIPRSPPPTAEVEPGTTTTASIEINDVPCVDPELLQALGDFEGESNEWGPDISMDLAKRWEPILKEGLKKELKEELVKRYPFPKNCPLMKPPVLNPEISAMLTESARNRDKRILKKQSQLACALTTLGRTMSDILTKSIDTPAILRNLSDTAKLIADSHYSETETRRSLVTPMVDKTFIEPFKDRKRDSHLFGEKLGDFIKSSRGIQKTGKLILSTASSANNLNYKPPPPHSQSNYRGGRQPNRGGGARAPATAYRRRPTAYQPPTARRQPASAPTPSTSQRHKQSRAAKQKE